MDLDLSDDQVALREGIDALLAGRFDSDRVRAGFDASVQADLAGAGVFSLRADGFGWADVAIVVERLGRAPVPGPVIAGVLLHGHVPGVVGLVEQPAAGEPAMVEHLDALDHLVVLAPDAVRVVAPGTLDAEPAAWPLDPLTPVHRVASLPAGEPIDLAPAQLAATGSLLTAAFAVGMAETLTNRSVAYAQEREQFGRSIGSFQAVKHILADMLVRTEVARAAVYAAATHLDEPDEPGAERAVSGAALLAVEAAIENGRAATQVHGGMGFTWEVDVHLFLKRAWVLRTWFGGIAAHADRLARAVR